MFDHTTEGRGRSTTGPARLQVASRAGTSVCEAGGPCRYHTGFTGYIAPLKASHLPSVYNLLYSQRSVGQSFDCTAWK